MRVPLELGAVEDPVHARKLLTREPGDPMDAQGEMVPPGRSGKAEGRTPAMNVPGKSDSREVPEKRPNKGEQSPAEVVEGRRLTEGNSHETAAPRTQGREHASNGLMRVREVARREGRSRFTEAAQPKWN